ncbi:Cbs domain protein [Striga asiatica]|uniref:Cbs domain protein n=1 Tax=Striga asiatica TaxID=4170 RepID=A0A5A7PSS4_STRAF|nr:Cbs domain protein [Striga asiatica]
MQIFRQAIGYYHKCKVHSYNKQQTTLFSPKNNQNGLTGAKAAQSHTISDKGLQNTTVAEVLMTKGQEKVGSWLWCNTDETVYDAVKRMAQNNIGSLVVLKPGEQQHIAGILTERDYLRKMVLQDRISKYTKVGEIMTEQDKLITVTSDTSILRAMQLIESHKACPSYRREDCGNDIYCGCGSSSSGAATWRSEATQRVYIRRLLLDLTGI